MSIFTIERALRPQQGDIAQLFIVFADTTEEGNMDVFCRKVAKAFPSAAIVVALPSEALLHSAAIKQKQLLSDEDLHQFVQAHYQDIQGFIKAFQSQLYIDVLATALVGIGQMGSLVLELSKLEKPLSGRIIAFGSRFAKLPEITPSLEQTLHLFHDEKDSLVDSAYTKVAHETITSLEGDVTMDMIHQHVSSFQETLLDKMVNRLLTCVPLRYLQEAQKAQPLTSYAEQDNDTIH